MENARITHTLGLIGLLAIVCSLLLSSNPAEAARGSKGGGSPASITLAQPSVHMGDTVTFSTNGGSRIAVACYQGGLGNMVYSADQAVGTSFTLLANATWSETGGDSLCYAWLYTRSLSKGALASTTFMATP